ncbi:MAG: Cys-rich peptide radical SAM maturase CcpM [Clostridia bacterium]|nr:Cys-rich peptide radical SAM maturase CcpM [Clostridia bacterium]
MAVTKPFIHLFTLHQNFYIYDVNKNAIVKIDEDTCKSLRTYQKDAENIIESDIVTRMKDSGFLSSKRAFEIVHPDNELLHYYINNKVCMIALQITQQCNLRCQYCAYSGNYLNRNHSNKKMDFETAKKGIDFAINHSREFPHIFIGFYGGEPLMEFDMIKKCIEYAINQAEGKEIIFNLTTNATLLNEEIVAYFEKYNVNLLISLDGPKHVHNKNRVFAGNDNGTFDVVMKNLENISKKFPEYFKKILYNVVLDPQNDFSCTNEFFTNFETIKDSFVTASDISSYYLKDKPEVSEDYLIKRNYEIFKLFLSKLNRLDEKYTSKLVMRYYSDLKKSMYDDREHTNEISDKNHHGGPCIPGVNRLFMNVNGDLYPCERVSESSETMKIGNVDTGFEIEKIRSLLNIGSLTEDKCKNCWAFRFCYLCAAAADGLNELSAEIKASNCERVRANGENLLKDYCTLIELGHKFEDGNNMFAQYV